VAGVARRLQHGADRSEWRYAPTPKWIRARRAGETVADSKRALLVWEPGMPFPWYAFPREDVSVDGVELTEPGVEGHVLLRFRDADEWLEEEEVLVGHPRDPFHRIDVRRSSRHVVVELDGEVLADSHRPALLFETSLPVRTYLPPEDVRTELLRPSGTVTTCAYKGPTVHFSTESKPDIAWMYEQTLPDGPDVAGLIAFYDERVDVTVDGERRERPVTPWSRPPRQID
jgi:uncharacterized protein (DUF427 family)